MNKKYIVTLTDEERAELQAMIAGGKRAAHTLALPAPSDHEQAA